MQQCACVWECMCGSVFSYLSCVCVLIYPVCVSVSSSVSSVCMCGWAGRGGGTGDRGVLPVQCVWTFSLPCLVFFPVLFAFLPVKSNAAKVQDGGSGQQYIQRGSDQAEGLPVTPTACGQLNSCKWHHHQRHQEVGKSERHNEVVGLLFPEQSERKED